MLCVYLVRFPCSLCSAPNFGMYGNPASISSRGEKKKKKKGTSTSAGESYKDDAGVFRSSKARWPAPRGRTDGLSKRREAGTRTLGIECRAAADRRKCTHPLLPTGGKQRGPKSISLHRLRLTCIGGGRRSPRTVVPMRKVMSKNFLRARCKDRRYSLGATLPYFTHR